MIKMHEMLHFLQIFLILLVSWPSRFNKQRSKHHCIEAKCWIHLLQSSSDLLSRLQGLEKFEWLRETQHSWAFLGFSADRLNYMQAFRLGLKQLYGGSLCESECDYVCELMNFSLVHEQKHTLTWSARPWLWLLVKALCLRSRGPCGILMIQVFWTSPAWTPLGNQAVLFIFYALWVSSLSSASG